MRHDQLLLFALCLVTVLVHGSMADDRKPYIIYMGEVPSYGQKYLVDEHHDLLVTAIGDEETARASKVYSFGKSFNGFVAKLLPQEADRLSDDDRIISVFENTNRELHTTRSWDFLGMTEERTRRKPAIESNVIVGLLDTGIYLKAPSFRDKGFGPAPSKWKGTCTKAHNFTGCNNKVIGARYYNLVHTGGPDEEQSPIDEEGHGSHTSSTAAGSAVSGASLYGIAKGTARGGVPAARIAMYKVCWAQGCSDADILAAFDDAIHDGVDVISLSVGGPAREFFLDSIAIGSFHAMTKGILTSCSGGNDGPDLSTIENVAPWIFTVAASSIDRGFLAAIKLGNGENSTGFAINTFTPKKTMRPLTSGALAGNKSIYGNSSACDDETLDEKKVKGKIVYCLGSNSQDYTIRELGGAGAVMSSDDPSDFVSLSFLPATVVDVKAGSMINHYINSTKNPHAIIYKTRTAKMKAPSVASFSSRGPQSISPNILKPDIAAPGLHILAGYSKLATPTGLSLDNRHVVFNIMSGTSMSCPHAAGTAAYVQSFHPKWSPAAVKSAVMTTATPMKIRDEYGALSTGSGQINPVMSPHPGLVYDISPDSYIAFLCKEGYNDTKISMLIGGNKKHKCSSYKPAQGTDGLNYPSMHTQLNMNETKISAKFHRTVTNVGFKNSTYRAKVTSPKDLAVNVEPSVLRFTRLRQQLSFEVMVKGAFRANAPMLSATLEWTDGKHSVKSPILVFRQLPLQ